MRRRVEQVDNTVRLAHTSEAVSSNGSVVPPWVASRRGLSSHNVGIPTAWSTSEHLSGHVLAGSSGRSLEKARVTAFER